MIGNCFTREGEAAKCESAPSPKVPSWPSIFKTVKQTRKGYEPWRNHHPPPQWVLDLNSPAVTKSKAAGIPDPPGYPAAALGSKKQMAAAKQNVRKPPTTEETDTLKVKKAWEVALAPIKQLPMTAIMMYMSGNGLQIFSIMMVMMAFKNPIMGLMATNSTFERFESEGTREKLLIVKAAYVGMQFLAMAMGVWKVNAMGLLPTTRSDWLAWESAREPLEYAIPAF